MAVTLPSGWTTSITGCSTCPEGTVPTAPQSLSVLHCYDITGGVPDGTIGGNNAGQMNFVTGQPESFVALTTNQSGFPVAYPSVTDYQVIEATGETLAGITALTLPGGRTANFTGQSAGTGRNGHSDERAVMHTLTTVNPTYLGDNTALAYFSYDTNTVTLFLLTAGTVASTWAKRGDRFWHTRIGPIGLDRYSVAAGGAPVTNGDLSAICANTEYMRSLHATDNYLYLAVRGGGSSDLYRLDLDTMAVIATYPSMPATVLSTFAISDDLHLIWNRTLDGLTWEFYYFIPSTSALVLIDGVSIECSPDTQDQSGQLSMQYNKGYIYLSSGAFGNGAPNITKIGPLLCPGLDVPIGSIL